MIKLLISLKTRIVLSLVLLCLLISAAYVYQSRETQLRNVDFVATVQNDDSLLLNMYELRSLTQQYKYEADQYQQLLRPSVEKRTQSLHSLKSLHDQINLQYKTYLYLHDKGNHIEPRRADEVLQGNISNFLAASTSYINYIQGADKIPPQEHKLLIDDRTSTLIHVLGETISIQEEHISEELKHNKKASNQAIHSSVYIGIGSIFAALIVALNVSSNVSKRLNDIKRGIRRIENGDLSAKIPIRTNDDIGQLALGFNEMIKKLQNSYHRLSIEKRRVEAILEGMDEGIVAVNEHGNIVLINHAAITFIKGSSKKQIEGRLYVDCLDLYDEYEKKIPTEWRPITKTLTNGEHVTDIFKVKSKDTFITIEMNTSPVSIKNEIAGAIIVIRDVTRAKEVDNMKTDFISLASHQLRTPLSAIHWFAELLLSEDAGRLKKEQQELAQNIFDSTERIIELVGSLLNISRMESGRINIDPSPTNIEKLLENLIKDLAGRTTNKNHRIRINIHKEVGTIVLDPKLISQVFLNLLTNAVKYTPEGGKISVVITKKNNEVLVSVSDNGYGIPKSQQSKVFQKFFRAGNVLNIETDGTGLGLYLTKIIVESSGGRIWFESTENKGTIFWFTLPFEGMKPKKGEVSLEG